MTAEHYFTLAFFSVFLISYGMWDAAESFEQVFRSLAVAFVGAVGVTALVVWVLFH